MSDAEKFEAQGRAHAALKQAKSNVATIKTKLLAYADKLQETAAMVRRFVETPNENNPHSSIPRAQNVKTHLWPISDDTARLVDDLAVEATKVQELQSQIDQF